ncbi:MAG: amidohydrolase family protein [Betaproteobacteria bacterium]|jgi:N-acyl-D-aspartate/D-glutamate deacylase
MEKMRGGKHALWCALVVGMVAAGSGYANDPLFDVVIEHGRVMDPESGLDAVRNIGIAEGVIGLITDRPLNGKRTIDATGLVVAPGFIDLHWHGTKPESHLYQAMDGVTASLELEIGVADIDRWYAEHEGREPIHYGAAIGHVPVRMQVKHDDGEFLPKGPGAKGALTGNDLADIKQHIEHGLQRGAVAVGMGIVYTPAATEWELLEVYRIAAKYHAFTHVHVRGASSAAGEGADREKGLLEVIALSAVSGAPVHIAHIQSSGQQSTPRMLDIIAQAQSHGVDITTECYPYTAGATRIESFLFDNWYDKPESEYQKLQWSATGERLTAQTFRKYREQGGLVLIHANTEEIVTAAVASPLTMIASDGFDVAEGQGHPRSAGTFSRVLGRYVRELKVISLMDGLRKMTLMPAQRLEERVPAMRKKGRIRLGADADLTLFDPERIIDVATFERPAQFSSGVKYVLVGGVAVVEGGVPRRDLHPGRPIRAAITN